MSGFWSFLSRPQPTASSQPGASASDGAQPRFAGSPEEQVIGMIRREYPAFTAAEMQRPFDDLGIDSVGMLMLHTAIEEATNNAFDRRQWDGIVTPADLAKALPPARGKGSAHAAWT